LFNDCFANPYVLFINIVGCFNCAYLGFYGRDSFTGFDLFAHLVILSVNQYCNSWCLYCAYVVGLFTSQECMGCLQWYYFTVNIKK